MDEIIKFGGVLGFLLGLADFNNYEFRLKSGSVRRVFEDEGHHDVMLEFYDGRVCYAKDTDFYIIDKVIRTYSAENPEQFEAYKKHYKEWAENYRKGN